MGANVYKVKCAGCGSVLQFTPQDSDTQRVRCPQCGQRMRVRTPTSAALSPPDAPLARPAATVRPQPIYTASPAAAVDWENLPGGFASAASVPPKAATPQYFARPQSLATPRYLAAPQQPALPPRSTAGGRFAGYRSSAPFGTPAGPSSGAALPARRQSSGMPTALKVLLGVAAVFGGGSLVLVLLVAVVAMIGGAAGILNQPQAKSTLSIAGWAVDAPGNPGKTEHQPLSEAKMILHRTTQSEFVIGTKRVAEPGQAFTVDMIVDMMRGPARVRNEQPVTRAGMQGRRFTMQVPNGAHATMEMFKIDESHVLTMVYVSGAEKQRVAGRNPRHDDQKTRELDDPEAFFASLRRG